MYIRRIQLSVNLKNKAKKGPRKALFFIRRFPKGVINPSRQKCDLFGAKVEVIGSYQVVMDFIFDPIKRVFFCVVDVAEKDMLDLITFKHVGKPGSGHRRLDRRVMSEGYP